MQHLCNLSADQKILCHLKYGLRFLVRHCVTTWPHSETVDCSQVLTCFFLNHQSLADCHKDHIQCTSVIWLSINPFLFSLCHIFTKDSFGAFVDTTCIDADSTNGSLDVKGPQTINNSPHHYVRLLIAVWRMYTCQSDTILHPHSEVRMGQPNIYLSRFAHFHVDRHTCTQCPY